MKKIVTLFIGMVFAFAMTACATSGDIEGLQSQIDEVKNVNNLQDRRIEAVEADTKGIGDKVNALDHEFNEKLNLLFEKTMQK